MTVKIKVNGPIISNGDKWFYDWFEEEATCPNDVLGVLPDNNEDVELSINSYGGLLDSGNEIYTALRNYPGKVTANVIMAGSAASIIAMSADVVKMSPVGQIMIHNVQMGAGGDYHDMDKASEILQKSNKSIASAYEAKTGKSHEEILALMDRETWMTAQEAVELGFADDVMFESQEKPLLVASGANNMINPKIIAKVRELKNQQEKPVAEIKVNLDEIHGYIDEKLNEIKNKKDEPVNESPFTRFFF